MSPSQVKFRRMKAAPPLLPLLLLSSFRTEAMEVTGMGLQTIQKAWGETVKLGCTYTPGPQDTGQLDIEWSKLNPDMTQRDQLVLSYTGGQVHWYGDPKVSSRFRFTGNPAQGDASVSVSDLRGMDTATYQCKAKKAPGVDMKKVTLVVLVPPSTPKCWAEGPEEKGGPVSLNCKSSKGSTPISYRWSRETGSMPTSATQNTESGELLIHNHTEANVGNYVCEARNSVGRAQCKYAVHAYNPTNKVGVIVGAVIGACLLWLLLLLLLLLLLCCCCRKRRYEEEVANDIREDTKAPERRSSTRRSSLRSVLGYRTHPGVYYSSVQKHQPGIRESTPNVIHTGGGSMQSSNGGKNLTRLNYNHKYGYPV